MTLLMLTYKEKERSISLNGKKGLHVHILKDKFFLLLVYALVTQLFIYLFITFQFR